jgi:hypothetical protein
LFDGLDVKDIDTEIAPEPKPQENGTLNEATNGAALEASVRN